MNWSIFQDGFLTPLLNAPSSFMCCIATAAASKRFHKKTDEPYYCLGSLLLLTIPDPPSFQISFLSYPPLLQPDNSLWICKNWYWYNNFFSAHFSSLWLAQPTIFQIIKAISFLTRHLVMMIYSNEWDWKFWHLQPFFLSQFMMLLNTFFYTYVHI